MNKAEDRTLEAYPPKIDGDSRGAYDFNELNRIKYLQGYHQAEKDNELGWEDVQNIRNIISEMMVESYTGNSSWSTHKEFCEEVLKRFNEQRKEK